MAWEPDMVSDVGPFKNTEDAHAPDQHAEQLGALMLALRERSLAAGTAGREVRTLPGPGWSLIAIYLATMAAAAGFVILH